MCYMIRPSSWHLVHACMGLLSAISHVDVPSARCLSYRRVSRSAVSLGAETMFVMSCPVVCLHMMCTCVYIVI